jgi:hypothetical protein
VITLTPGNDNRRHRVWYPDIGRVANLGAGEVRGRDAEHLKDGLSDADLAADDRRE